jgi:DNA-directed RNA polymerase omega subunit
MLLNPPIDKLIEKFDSPYQLAVVVGKRARVLSQTLSESEKEQKKEVSRAIAEAYEGKIKADKNSIANEQ